MSKSGDPKAPMSIGMVCFIIGSVTASAMGVRTMVEDVVDPPASDDQHHSPLFVPESICHDGKILKVAFNAKADRFEIICDQVGKAVTYSRDK